MAEHHDFVVKDISLADWGRKEIAIAEVEMPALMDATQRDQYQQLRRSDGANPRGGEGPGTRQNPFQGTGFPRGNANGKTR